MCTIKSYGKGTVAAVVFCYLNGNTQAVCSIYLATPNNAHTQCRRQQLSWVYNIVM